MAEADIEAAAAVQPRSPASPLMTTVAELRALLPGALRELLRGIAENVVLGFVSAMLVNYCAFLASPLACVKGAALFDAFFVGGGLVFLGFFAFSSVVAMGFLLCLGFITLLLLWYRGAINLWGEAEVVEEIGGDGVGRMPAAAQQPGPESAGARGRQKLFYNAVAVLLLLTVAPGLLLILLPATGYCGDRVCSMPMDIRCFPNSVAVLLRHFINLFGPTKR